MKQTQRLTPLYASLFGLALMVLLAACDQTAPTSSAPNATPAAPETELVQFATEDGTVLGAVHLPVGTAVPEALRVTEQDGHRTMILSDETIAGQTAPRSVARGPNGPQSPTMVRGKYCADIVLPFPPFTAVSERCDHLTAVDTPGSGPRGQMKSEINVFSDGSTVPGYKGPPGCIETFESGLVVVSSPIEKVELDFPLPFDLFGTDARFYYPDGTVAGSGLVGINTETCEDFRGLMELVAGSSVGQEARGRLTVIR